MRSEPMIETRGRCAPMPSHRGAAEDRSVGLLIERDDSILAIVDAQPGFYRSATDVGDLELRAVIDRIAWLAGVAAALDIPIVLTEEDPARNGSTASAVLGRLPVGAPPPFVKPVFGLADVPEILDAIEATGRRTAVLTGFETDVCVAHSALGLLDREFRVAAVVDATGSPGEMHAHGLQRMAGAGVTLIHAKGVYYEWVRTLAAARAFEEAHPELAEPPGFSL
jgi:nicotinamidase-related amidase